MYLANHKILVMRCKYSLFILLFILPLFVFSTSLDSNDKPIKHPKKVYRKALRQIGNGKLTEAKENLSNLINAFPENYEFIVQMALLYFWDFGDYKSATPYFEKALTQSDDKDLNADLEVFLAKCYQFNNRFESSNRLYQKFIDEHPDDKNMIIASKKAIKDNNYALKSLKDIPINFAMIKHFGKRINSRFPDYVPVLINHDSTLLFTSRRPINEIPNSYFEAFDYPENIYHSEKHKKGFEKATIFIPNEFYGDFYKKGFHHHSIVNISFDGTKMILYAKNKLWLTQRNENSWNKPKRFQKKINFSFYQPHACFSVTGDTLFFTSVSKKKGIGNRDIYYSVKKDNGNWADPQLVPEINTPLDEDCPELTSDGKKLYFASNGLDGMGGFDIYVSELHNNKWQKPRNLGIPINSSGDDIFYKPSVDDQMAFFSSWRKGGFGNMDIYQAIKQAQFKDCETMDSSIAYPLAFDCADTMTVGKLYRFKGNFAKIPNALAERIFWNFGEGNIRDSLMTHHTFFLPSTNTVKLEVFAFDTIERVTKDFCVSKNIFVATNEYLLALNNQDFSSDSITASNPNLNQFPTDTISRNQDIVTAQTITVDSLTVYYDFDIRTFRKIQTDEVDNFISNQIKINPNAKIKIIGYTDYWGNYKYNFILSKQRAETLKTYLVDKGIDISRFVETEGKGESEQITEESLLKNHPYAHTIPELNRRVKIILLK